MSTENNFEQRIEKLRDLIASASKIVFFGGAGVSTESGIPDFRSKDGLYNQKDIRFDKYKPEYLLNRQCLNNEPEVFFEFYRQKLDVRTCQPNMAHIKLAELEKAGKISAIITQNIDGLHQKAGSTKVYEIHGTTRHAYCMSCNMDANPDIFFDGDDPIPKCPHCGGIIRPDVTLYGESLPSTAWMASVNALNSADLLIVGGTSLSVYPAASLIQEYYGDNLVVINHDETNVDRYASLVFHESLGDVFSRI